MFISIFIHLQQKIALEHKSKKSVQKFAHTQLNPQKLLSLYYIVKINELGSRKENEVVIVALWLSHLPLYWEVSELDPSSSADGEKTITT